MIGRQLAALLVMVLSGCVGPGERAEDSTTGATPIPTPTGGTVTRPLTTPLRADFTVTGTFEVASRSCSATMTPAPTTGPAIVPIPPRSVIRITSPDICQATSVSVAN